MPQLELIRTKIQELKKTEEYYNSIRTNVQLSGNNITTIVITSVQPDEGKSTTSVNLATSFARAGFKTLLIDADIRNSVMTGTFKAKDRVKGLTSYLSGNSELTEVICDTNIDHLMVITSGQVAPNPTALIQNANFKRMIEIVSELFDYVIIDSPPIGLVADPAIIAQQCDASILVTEAGAIRRRFVRKAKEQMEQSHAQFLGVILNKVDVTDESYGSYGSYGDYGKVEKKKKKNKSRREKRA